MTIPFAGKCACGRVAYQCGSAPLAMYNCHCRACQMHGNGGFSAILVLATSALAITGPLQYYSMPAAYSSHAECGFCPHCGTPICARNEGNPLVIILRMTSVQDAAWFKPVADIWTISAQPWTVFDRHIPKVYKSPPVLEKAENVNM